MSDRAQALTALRPARATGLPAPPPRPVVVLPDVEVDNSDQDQAAKLDVAAPPRAGSPELPDAAPPQTSQVERGTPDDGRTAERSSFTFAGLVDRPVEICKAMTDLRAAQPSKPLNVDITPGIADDFDQRCRTLRVKKKDVVEVLLRAWLDAGDKPPTG